MINEIIVEDRYKAEMRQHNIGSMQCWCKPNIEHYEYGDLIIHHHYDCVQAREFTGHCICNEQGQA